MAENTKISWATHTMNFWKQEHGPDLLKWEGVMISWRDLRPA